MSGSSPGSSNVAWNPATSSSALFPALVFSKCLMSWAMAWFPSRPLYNASLTIEAWTASSLVQRAKRSMFGSLLDGCKALSDAL